MQLEPFHSCISKHSHLTIKWVSEWKLQTWGIWPFKCWWAFPSCRIKLQQWRQINHEKHERRSILTGACQNHEVLRPRLTSRAQSFIFLCHSLVSLLIYRVYARTLFYYYYYHLSLHIHGQKEIKEKKLCNTKKYLSYWYLLYSFSYFVRKKS